MRNYIIKTFETGKKKCKNHHEFAKKVYGEVII